MLSGRFLNCYGMKEFNLPAIDFTRCNKAIIYAPNGVMKTSFSKVFEDISQGKPSTDRIFQGVTTSYAVTYYASQYNYTSAFMYEPLIDISDWTLKELFQRASSL